MTKSKPTHLKDQFSFLFEEELLEEMMSSGSMQKVPAGKPLMDIGDTITEMPLLLEGSIKIMTEDEEGQELLLYYLEPGDTCAVTLNCCSRSTKSTIKAITERESLLYIFDVRKMDDWMAKYKSWRSFVLESYNSRLNEMLAAIDNLVFNRMPERLTRYLKDKVWAQKSQELTISHAEIANDLHSSRVVISRLMKQLEKDGLIKQQRGKISVLKID